MQGTLVAPALLERLVLREELVKLLGPLCQCLVINGWRGGLRLQCIVQVMRNLSTLEHFNASLKHGMPYRMNVATQATLEAPALQERPGLPERQVKSGTPHLPKSRDEAMY